MSKDGPHAHRPKPCRSPGQLRVTEAEGREQAAESVLGRRAVVGCVAAVSAEPTDISAVQTAKIARLRNAVETGTYKVDLETLASRIVDDEVMREGATKS